MKRICLFLIISVLSWGCSLLGQTVQFMTLSVDARTLSMGGTGVVAPANAFAIYNNNSAVTFSDLKGAFAASYTMWQPKTAASNLINVSGFLKTGKRGAIILGSRCLMHSAYEMANDQGSITGTYKPMEITADLGYAYMITKTLSTAATVRYIISNMSPDASGSAIAADLGLMYNPGNISFGLTVTNLGSNINYGYDHYTLPAQIKLGAGYSLHTGEKHLLSAAVQAGYLIVNSGITAGIGLEYSYNNLLSFRIGGHYGDSGKSIPSYVSAGLGFRLRGLTLNAAYLLAQKNTPLTNSLSINLGWEF
ncbi:MAG TPA: PorV/PorQ family protein [Bacteroidales bacterium]|nr:PorV/PorQ family protein [Bacteroidales bacterium]